MMGQSLIVSCGPTSTLLTARRKKGCGDARELGDRLASALQIQHSTKSAKNLTFWAMQSL